MRWIATHRPATLEWRRPMRIVPDRRCGLDVHQKSVVACVTMPECQETRSFGTTTRQLLELADLLKHGLL